MLKRISQILNIFIISACGVFLGHTIYIYHDFLTRPGLYAMQSAPWYTSILVYGICLLGLLGVSLILKAVIHKKLSNR